jgi:hypothetical protein
MKFTQIGTVSPKQKQAIKASSVFRSFLRVAQAKGAIEVILIAEMHDSGWIRLYGKTPDLLCNYWADVGVRGGLAGETFKTSSW